MKRPRTLRGRLFLAVLFSVAVALGVMTLVFNLLLWRSLSTDADTAARTRAQAEIGAFDVSSALQRPHIESEGQTWIVVDGQAVEQPHLGAAIEAAARALLAGPGAAYMDVPFSHTRLYAAAPRHLKNKVVRVASAISLSPYETTRRVALIASLSLAALILLVVALAARWLLGAALRPVARMTSDASAWGEHDLGRRFAEGEPYDEISQLATTLDGLLGRIEASLRREQRFSSEMSHELRTPLARICAESELALRRPRQPSEYREALETVLRNARQLSSTVDTLVLVAQQESGLARGRADAYEVLSSCAETCVHLAAERKVRLQIGPEPEQPIHVGVDGDVAARILQPVLENACRYANGELSLTLSRDGADVVISVTDDGPGVRPDEAESIFSPGVRGSAAEAAGDRAPGAGLGLSLARRLAQAAGGSVEAVPGDCGLFIVRLPAG
jgi:two-component system, OmpR family, sensor kinase